MYDEPIYVSVPMISLGEYLDAERRGLGWCDGRCDGLVMRDSEDHGGVVDPDAAEERCPDCGEDTLYGLRAAHEDLDLVEVMYHLKPGEDPPPLTRLGRRGVRVQRWW